MAGLQRSAISFRRQGSSGLVWEDRFVSGELNQVNQTENQTEQGQDQDHDKAEIKEIKTRRNVGINQYN
ncbi:MAPK kinase substrate protein [Quillaja saponaria]|uniref:MAPK kinase substrate protein n=1 Tax=Quillaja saponaria TaxID=32244 RepID=A0AAD7PDS7_QUISA|nr:MAPK kinase substrate protein [Quillaja saponaria]